MKMREAAVEERIQYMLSYMQGGLADIWKENICHMQVYSSRNDIPGVILIPNYTSPPSTVATFLVTCLMAVVQPSRYSVFHSGDTPIQLSLP